MKSKLIYPSQTTGRDFFRPQGAKKVSFTARHSGKLWLVLILQAQNSFQLAPKTF